jgi:hypothetical protein
VPEYAGHVGTYRYCSSGWMGNVNAFPVVMFKLKYIGYYYLTGPEAVPVLLSYYFYHNLSSLTVVV